jgi:SAM-dependent methyltransferase
MTDAARRFFDGIAPRYDRVYGLHGRESRDRIARVLDVLAPRSRILDLGVGTGRELSALQDARHDPVGVDVSREMLAVCARRARPVPLVEADFWRPLPFDDASFDAALALHGTLAHSPDDASLARLFAELARVLRPEAVVYAEVPSEAWLTQVTTLPPVEGRRLERTAADTCLYEDLVAGVAIEVRVLPESSWRALLAPAFAPVIAPLGPEELTIVARRRAA